MVLHSAVFSNVMVDMVHILMKFRECILNIFQIPQQENHIKNVFFFHFKGPQLLKVCNRESTVPAYCTSFFGVFGA